MEQEIADELIEDTIDSILSLMSDKSEDLQMEPEDTFTVALTLTKYESKQLLRAIEAAPFVSIDLKNCIASNLASAQQDLKIQQSRDYLVGIIKNVSGERYSYGNSNTLEDFEAKLDGLIELAIAKGGISAN